jgi:hypothetical protein
MSFMTKGLEDLMTRSGDKVRKVLNLLVESPYFYRSDDEPHFLFLSRNKRSFESFFDTYYGWKFHMDGKCARVYKPTWHNQNITPAKRDVFDFTRRDEAMAFMMLLEFFEKQLDAQAMTVDERDNLRFRYGDLLEYVTHRFQELMQQKEQYTSEHVRSKILRVVIPQLERYRFLQKVEKSTDDEKLGDEDTLYEALPALWHFNTDALSRQFTGKEQP